jgi:hypothetical protein
MVDREPPYQMYREGSLGWMSRVIGGSTRCPVVQFVEISLPITLLRRSA